MECLKFRLFSPCATFKTPFSLKGIETYPLPTYSTIIGLLYTAAGRRWQGEKFSISVQGTYKSIFRDYIRFRKYNRKDKLLEVLPIEVPKLFELECVIHIVGQRDLLVEFERSLKNPSTYLFLGGGEYPVMVKDVKIVSYQERAMENQDIKLSAYVPERYKQVFSGSGIAFRIPSFWKDTISKGEWTWQTVYYYPNGSYIEGEVFVDEEGDFLWV
ncbi:type I-B CRISPR-associated protein Cas5b [Thermocrinis minervae]|uniref:CRISPR-associated protein, Cas5t family n=1 Tax=Thermocrinis minervae TaxID=381751 RepID=A0A1M6Q5D9_9AQUI|nr:type I-B CRISPR-associated protein Cas5b [Thermocrinis minervae]SHK15484.1 CRISPR-associated protein, Cas5t family [Thermocrinis minervae]